MAARWSLFAGVAGAVLLLLVALARLSAAAVTTGDSASRSPNGAADAVDDRERREQLLRRETKQNGSVNERLDSQGELLDSDVDAQEVRSSRESERSRSEPRRDRPEGTIADLESMSTSALLVNVALSQGLLGSFLLLGAWYAEIPLAAFGVVATDPWNLGAPALAVGLGVGATLYAGNELLGGVIEGLGIDYSEELREALAPDTLAGWLALLVVVLPAIAAFEELLFRGALVGALAVGFGVSPWLLAALSSVAFAVGHGMQGPGGVLVTGLLGFALAVAFVLTGSLLVVVVAHYVVNAFEFVVHEGLGWEPIRNV